MEKTYSSHYIKYENILGSEKVKFLYCIKPKENKQNKMGNKKKNQEEETSMKTVQRKRKKAFDFVKVKDTF